MRRWRMACPQGEQKKKTSALGLDVAGMQEGGVAAIILLQAMGDRDFRQQCKSGS
jgi:hypothetical protein